MFLNDLRKKIVFCFVSSWHIASSLTLDFLERLSSRVLGMKQKRCNLLKARLSENDFQLSSLDKRNSSSYVKNMLMAQMNPILG